jgi:hypothetical protein
MINDFFNFLIGKLKFGFKKNKLSSSKMIIFNFFEQSVFGLAIFHLPLFAWPAKTKKLSHLSLPPFFCAPPIKSTNNQREGQGMEGAEEEALRQEPQKGWPKGGGREGGQSLCSAFYFKILLKYNNNYYFSQ